PVSAPPETPMDAVGARSLPRRVPRWALVLMAVAVAAALGVLVYVRHRAGATAETAEPPPDVPRLEGKSIVFTPAFAKRSALKSATAESYALMPVVQVVGTVNFDSEHVSAAGTRISGFVTRVLKVEGDRVEKGDVLAEIESTDLGRAQAQVAVVMARKHAAERNAQREADLLSKNLTTAREEEMARAELEEQVAMLTAASHDVAALGGSGGGRMGTYFVRAPIRGSVVKRSVAAGQSVGSDVVAFRVADLDHLWIELSVFEREIGTIHVDDVVELTPTGGSDAKLEGKVAYVGEVIDPDTRTAEIRVKVDNQTRLLRPGQSVNARVRPAGLARQVTTVPVGAVTFVDGKPTVLAFVGKSDTEVVVKDVKLGRSDGERQEIVSGVTVGERVVSEGVFALKSELFR
ncbi:MAG TPA: efflux RND transporter periplasmic adaptor subunit, partial [Polyangiaceae bacterium]